MPNNERLVAVEGALEWHPQEGVEKDELVRYFSNRLEHSLRASLQLGVSDELKKAAKFAAFSNWRDLDAMGERPRADAIRERYGSFDARVQAR